MQIGERAIRENDFDCPAIVMLKDGGTLPLLEVSDDGVYTLDVREGTAASRLSHQELLALGPEAAFAFTLY